MLLSLKMDVFKYAIHIVIPFFFVGIFFFRIATLLASFARVHHDVSLIFFLECFLAFFM